MLFRDFSGAGRWCLAAAATTTLMAASGASGQSEAKLLASNGAAGDMLGDYVDICGDLAIVGAPFGDVTYSNPGHPLDGDSVADTGAAYIYRWDGASWAEETRLPAATIESTGLPFPLPPEKVVSPVDPGSEFGRSVAICGTTAVVGAPQEGDGSVYVFTYDTMDGWQEAQKLTPSDASDAEFGFSLAMDGDVIAVGARLGDKDSPAVSDSGTVYVYRLTGGVWVEEAELAADIAASSDEFGWSVSVSGDVIAVGALERLGMSPGPGSAYVFTYNGASWSQTAELPSDATASAQFGFSVSASGDTVVVGSPHHDHMGSGASAAYVYWYNGSAWGLQTELVSPETADDFGWSVAIDGDMAVIGARLDGTPSFGAAYVFDRTGSSWSPTSKKFAQLPDGTGDAAPGDEFGAFVAVDADRMLVGAPGGDDNGLESGKAYVYDLSSDPPPANLPPTADAGPGQSIHAGDAVQLDGSGSFDDNTATEDLLFAWAFTVKPVGSTAVLTAANTAMPSFVADLPGMYTVQLVVEDEEGLLSDPDEVVISSENLAPTADAGEDAGGVVGFTTVLDGSGSTDPDGDPLSFSWSFVSKPQGSTATFDAAGAEMPAFVPDLPGIYEAQLVVSDPWADSAPDTVTITVISGEDFAELKLMEVLDYVAGLPCSRVTTRGNRRALTRFLSQAIDSIQRGDIDQALSKIDKTIGRTDGCVVYGSPDGNGPGRDWITDCGDQAIVYACLIMAREALTP